MISKGQPPCLPDRMRGSSLPVHVVLAPYFCLTPSPAKTGFKRSLLVMITPQEIIPHSWNVRKANKSRSKV